MRKTSCIVKVPEKGLVFSEAQIRSVTILEEVDPLTINLSSNKATISLYRPDGDLDLLLEENIFGLAENDKIEIYEKIDGVEQFMGLFYYDIATSADSTQITIECLDAINLLGKTTFYWGEYYNIIEGQNVYSKSRKTAGELAADILNDAGFEYYIEDSLKDLPIYGHLPVVTHRVALQYLAFAIGAEVSCARSNKINITKNKENTQSTITKGQKFESTAELTDYIGSIAVTTHDLRISTESASLTGINNQLIWTKSNGDGTGTCYTGDKLWLFGELICMQPLKGIQTDSNGYYKANIRWGYDVETGSFNTEDKTGPIDRTDRYIKDVKKNNYLVNATILNMNYSRNYFGTTFGSRFMYIDDDTPNYKKYYSYAGAINALRLVDNQAVFTVGEQEQGTQAEIKDCTLITSENAEEIGNRCLEYYQKRKKITFKLVLNDERAGKTYIIWVRNRYYIGTITSLSIDCTGGFLATATAICSKEYNNYQDGDYFITADGYRLQTNEKSYFKVKS